jgi:uncharacterized delta-60 repeat protein
MRLYIERSKKIAILILFVGVIGMWYQWSIKAALEYFSSAPEKLETISPVKTLIIDDIGRIDPLTVQSYVVKQKKRRDEEDVTYCSYVTYLNLKYLTEMQDWSFKRGDAITIWDDLIESIDQDKERFVDNTGSQNELPNGGNEAPPPLETTASGDQNTPSGEQNTGTGYQNTSTGDYANWTWERQDTGSWDQNDGSATGDQDIASGEQNTGGDILPPDLWSASGDDAPAWEVSWLPPSPDAQWELPPAGDVQSDTTNQWSNTSFVGDVQWPETYQVIENNGRVRIEHDEPDILTGVYESSGGVLLDLLDESFRDAGNTVFDIVTIRPSHRDRKDDINMAHRFTVFLGTDNERYVLDPVRTWSEDPIELSKYVEEHIAEKEKMIVVDAFKAGTQQRATAYEATDVIARSSKDMLAYAIKWLITPLQTGMAVIDTVRFQKSFRYESRKGKLRAKIPTGTIVKTKDKKYFDTSLFTVDQTSWDISQLSQVVDKDFVVTDKFIFGTPNQHLIFSQPVQISLDAVGMEEGRSVDILVQHEWQPWGNKWLTTNPNAQCDENGNLPEEDQAISTYVQSGKVVFYTCGASTFAIWYVPGIELPNAAVTAAREQSDWKMLIGWSFTLVWSTSRRSIARLNVDKSLDNAFNPNANGAVNAIKVQSDGKILIWWAFTVVGWITRNRVARLNTDGTLDTSFNPNANNTVMDIEIQDDGQILLWWTFTTISWATVNRIARLTTTWQLDTSFNPNANNTINDIGKVQPDGSMYIWWIFTTISWAAVNRLAKLTSTWQLVTTFNPNVNNAINDIKIQPDGNVLFWWTFTGVGATIRNGIARVTSAWVLDNFNPNPNSTGAVNNIDIEADGDVIFGGTFLVVSWVAINRVARVNSGWVRDATFNPNSNNAVSIVRVLSSWKIFLGWSFTTLWWISQWFIAFLNNTIIDTVYNARPSAVVSKVLVQPDGWILLWWGFTTVWWVARNRIARLVSTWVLDTGFNPNANSAVYEMALETGGRIIVWWAFTTMGWTARNFIARLTTTGALDTTFNPNANAAVSGIVLQTDGKILIWWAFTTVSGTARNFIARLTTTWAVDTTFNPNANGAVTDIELQSDGKILIAWVFTTISWTAVNRLARLTTTWALDTTFNPNVNNRIEDIALQSDWSVVLWWTFTWVGGVWRNFLARVSSTWALDTTFNPNPSNTVFDIKILNDQSIIAWWAFTHVWGITRTELVKISPLGVVDNNLDVSFLTTGTSIRSMDLDSENNLLVWGTFTRAFGNANLPFFTWVWLGNYTNMAETVFWLDAWVWLNCFTSWCAISWWMEKAYGQTGSQAVAGNQPAYQTMGINFNPTVKFSGFPNGTSGVATFDYINYGMTSLSTIVNKMTIISVQNLRTAGNHYTIWLLSGAASWRYGSSFFQSSKWSSQATGGIIGTPYISSVSVNDSSSSHYINGVRMAASNLTTWNFITWSQLWVWATESSGAYSTEELLRVLFVIKWNHICE